MSNIAIQFDHVGKLYLLSFAGIKIIQDMF